MRRDEAARALERWVGEDLARQHRDAFIAELPPHWLSMIARTESQAGQQKGGA